MKNWKNYLSILLVAIWVACCCEPEEKTVYRYQYLDNPEVLPVPSLVIHNHVNQPDATVLLGQQDYFVDNLLFEPTSSQEDMIIYSLVIQDNFTGTGDFTELQNLEIWTDFSFDYDNLDFDLNWYHPDTIIGGPFNPEPGSAPGTLTIPLNFPIVLKHHNYTMMSVVADIAANGDTTTPATHTIKVIGADVMGLESDTYCTPVIQNLGVTLTLADRGIATLKSNPESPLRKLLAPSDGFQDIMKFNLQTNDAEGIDLRTFMFNMVGKFGFSTPRLEASTGFVGSWSGIPTPVSGPFGFSWYMSPPLVDANSEITLTLKLYPTVGIPYTLNGEPFQILSVDLTAYGHTSNKIIQASEELFMPQMYLFTTYPVFSLSSASPSGNLFAGIDVPIAAFNIAAKPGGDISFWASKGNSLTVKINSRCSQNTANDILFLKDENNVVLASSGPVDICSSPSIYFDFSASDLTVLAGTSKKVVVTADTVDFVNQGEFIQAYLSADHPDNVGWYIPNQFSYSSNNHYADVIFRDNIYGHTLVVP